MARAIFLGLPLHGHTNPTLPLVRELVDRGEEVTYYAADAFAGRIEQAGAKYRPTTFKVFRSVVSQVGGRSRCGGSDARSSVSVAASSGLVSSWGIS
jgi:hypothetical protein